MNLVRFEPWSIAYRIHSDFDRRPHTATPASHWVPAFDVIEEKERFVLRADVPGVAAADIDVSMEDGVLSVSGERLAESRDEIDGLRRFERASGRFYRRFTLPETADATGIAAKSTNGILEVTIPKLPQVQPRRINVEAA